MHKSSQLCSLLSVEELLKLEVIVESLLNMCLYGWLFIDIHLATPVKYGDPFKKVIKILLTPTYLRHNIIQIHNNVLWDWQCSMEYSHIEAECEEYFVE